MSHFDKLVRIKHCQEQVNSPTPLAWYRVGGPSQPDCQAHVQHCLHTAHKCAALHELDRMHRTSMHPIFCPANFQFRSALQETEAASGAAGLTSSLYKSAVPSNVRRGVSNATTKYCTILDTLRDSANKVFTEYSCIWVRPRPRQVPHGRRAKLGESVHGHLP